MAMSLARSGPPIWRTPEHGTSHVRPRADTINFIFLELPNCSKALTPEASLLDNFCYSLHNMQFLPNRPIELRQEIFELLFESAEIAKFTPEEVTKYQFDMTTERDRRNQLKKATEDGLKEGREKGLAEGRAEGRASVAARLLEMGSDIDFISQATGLPIEEIQSLVK